MEGLGRTSRETRLEYGERSGRPGQAFAGNLPRERESEIFGEMPKDKLKRNRP